MRTSLPRSALALLLVFGAAAALGACTGGVTSNGPSPGVVPAPPPGPPSVSSTKRTFALTKLLLGETSRDGQESTSAWKAYGYDLDGKVSARGASDVCSPAPSGLSAISVVDGDDGIDNAFGAQLIPLLQTFTAKPSAAVTASIQSGRYTYLLETVGLTDDAAQTNTGMTMQVFLGAPLEQPPQLAPGFAWPAATGTLVGGALGAGALTRYQGAYATAGRWVAAPGAPLVLHLDLGVDRNQARIPAIDLPIRGAVVTFEHPTSGTVTNGTIAGVIATEDVVTAALPFMRHVACGSDLSSVETLIRGASDIRADGTNAAGAPCDAISIGIGFEAVEVGNVTTLGPDPTSDAAPCVRDGGVD
jgi:hypothetical protein